MKCYVNQLFVELSMVVSNYGNAIVVILLDYGKTLRVSVKIG